MNAPGTLWVREKNVLNGLNNRFADILQKVRGWGSLNEKNVQEGLRDMKRALLEADVNYKVVNAFMEKATAEAMGERVIRSVTPAQQFTKIIHDTLVSILGGESEWTGIDRGGISVVMLCGLQGSGKTTTAVKLAQYVDKTYNKKPLLVAADVYRPAAVQQLEMLARKAGYPVHGGEGDSPVRICKESIRKAAQESLGAVIIDTAGRLEMDQNMMAELTEIKKAVSPHEVFLVADSATGQSAVTVAQGFDQQLGLTGIILSRMDSDARGGAALSMAYVTGKGISFIGTGERVEDFERFHPRRIADRILNRGDVVSLVEKVQEDIDEEQASKLETKLRKNSFDLEDFLDQLRQIRKMGGLDKIMSMLPGGGMPGLPKKVNLNLSEDQLKHAEAIICSMTPYERLHHKFINGSRRKHIALGSGTSVFEVNRLLNNFDQMKKMMKKVKKGGVRDGASIQSLMQRMKR
jgi:signal recognition particle subunit SRP54